MKTNALTSPDYIISSVIDVAFILKTKREELGLTIEQASSSTKIRTELLKAIETGEFKKFPGKVYAVGFVRTYASFLALDQDYIVSSLKACPDFLKDECLMVEKKNNVVSQKKRGSKVLISIFLIAAFFLLVNHFIQNDTISTTEEHKEQSIEQE